MKPILYRNFLAFLPDPELRFELDGLCDAAGQRDKRIKSEHFHLTLCVISEFTYRDRFIARRLDAAFAHGLSSSCCIHLGKVSVGPAGAAIYTVGRQYEIQDFYRSLLRLLAQQQVLPLHRKSGLHPHVTLGYDPSTFAQFKALWEWIPGELVLIESEVGRGVHNVLRRWPLDPPAQYELPFEKGLPLLRRRRRVVGGRR